MADEFRLKRLNKGYSGGERTGQCMIIINMANISSTIFFILCYKTANISYTIPFLEPISYTIGLKVLNSGKDEVNKV